MLTMTDYSRESGTLHFIVTLKTEILQRNPASPRHRKTDFSATF